MYMFTKKMADESQNYVVLHAEGSSSTNTTCNDVGACDTTVNVGSCN